MKCQHHLNQMNLVQLAKMLTKEDDDRAMQNKYGIFLKRFSFLAPPKQKQTY